MPAVPLAPERVRRSIHILFAIQLVSMGAMEMSGPFWPLYLKSLSPSDLVFGFAGVGVYVGPMLGIMLTSMFWGRIGDRLGHKLMMVRALLGLSLTQLALAYSSDVWTILVLRFIQGACAGYIAPAQAYGASIEYPSRRARLFAYLQVSTNVGSLAGPVLGGVILDHAAFFWINFVASILCAVCAALAWLSLPDLPASKAAPKTIQSASSVADTGPSLLWRSSPIAGLLGIMGILLFSRMITQTPFSLYVTSILDVTNSITGLCYGLLALGFIVSASSWARYFEGKPLSDVLRRMAYVAAACAGLTAVAAITRHIGVFITVYFAWGVLLAATTPVLMSLISAAAGSFRQGYILGKAQSTMQLASIAGIALGGWLTQMVGLEYTYLFVSLSYVLAVIATLIVRWAYLAVQPVRVSPER